MASQCSSSAPPARPEACGSTTASTAWVAMAASMRGAAGPQHGHARLGRQWMRSDDHLALRARRQGEEQEQQDQADHRAPLECPTFVAAGSEGAKACG